MQIWLEQQQRLLVELQDQPVDLGGDGRCDSPGFCAKFMTYSLHEARLDKIIHAVQIEVGETEAVRTSVQMEKEGLIRSLAFLKQCDIKVRSLTTDRHPGIKKHMREKEPNIAHHFDVWHVAKGIKKKLTASTKAAGCTKLELWLQPTVNHMYWCAAVSRGNGDLLVDTWLTLNNHVINIHEGHKGQLKVCLHGPLDEAPWLLPGK